MKFFNLIFIELCNKIQITNEFLVKETGKDLTTIKRWRAELPPTILPHGNTIPKIRKAMISWYRLPENNKLINDIEFQELKKHIIEILPVEDEKSIAELRKETDFEGFLNKVIYNSRNIKQPVPQALLESIFIPVRPLESKPFQEKDPSFSQGDIASDPKPQEGLPSIITPPRPLLSIIILGSIFVVVVIVIAVLFIGKLYPDRNPKINTLSNYLPTLAISSNDFETQRFWNYTHPKEYTGEVWIKITPQTTNISKIHHYEIVWGGWKYKNDLIFNNSSPVVLKHRKDYQDANSLSLSISLPCDVVFGEGKVTDKEIKVININKGWHSLEDEPVGFIYQTFDSNGEISSWDNGTAERTLENSRNGSKVLKLTSKTIFGGCKIQCENGLWDVDLLPDNNEQAMVFSFWTLTQPDNQDDNTLGVKFFDQNAHFNEPVTYWTPNKVKSNKWDKVLIPLSEIRKMSPDLDFHHINKIEFQQYYPGTYYIENIFIIPQTDSRSTPSDTI